MQNCMKLFFQPPGILRGRPGEQFSVFSDENRTKNTRPFLFGKTRYLKAFMQNFYTEFNKNLSLTEKKL